jgi:DNA adenine methylase
LKTATRKLRSPLKWHGGKSYLARRITALFPPHDAYVEPFVGGGSVLLNKAPAAYEMAGDLNPELIAFWRELRDSPAFVDLLKEVPYDETTFETAGEWLKSDSRGCRAIGFLVRNRFSRGGLGKDFAWSDRLRGGQPGDVNAWQTIQRELPAIVARIDQVAFQNRHALELVGYASGLKAMGHRRVLIYCDPPYLHETRTAKDAYAHEMTRGDHEQLLVALRDIDAKVFLSGYRSALYDEALSDWTRHEWELPNHSGQGKTKQRRVECLWESPE